MSNFWARKLAGMQPPQPPSRPASAPWWSSAPQQQAPGPAGPLHAVQDPSVPEGHHVIQPSEINLRKLPSTFQPDHCPSCDSPDYFAATPNTRKRCFGCGYPLLHTTSGMSSTTKSDRGTPAKQVSQMTMTNDSGRILYQVDASAGAGGQSNYYPQDIRAGQL